MQLIKKANAVALGQSNGPLGRFRPGQDWAAVNPIRFLALAYAREGADVAIVARTPSELDAVGLETPLVWKFVPLAAAPTRSTLN